VRNWATKIMYIEELSYFDKSVQSEKEEIKERRKTREIDLHLVGRTNLEKIEDLSFLITPH